VTPITISLQISLGLRIFVLQTPAPSQDKEPRNDTTHRRKRRTNEENTPSPSELIRETARDRHKQSTCRSRYPLCRPLRRDPKSAVQHDEERENKLDGRERGADDETHSGPAEEAERHGLLAPDAVHEEAAGDAAGEIEAIHRGAEADVLDEGVVGVELSDDGAAEEAERVGHEVVGEPGETRANHGLPIALDCE